MSNLHNLQRIVIEMTSLPHHLTQTKNRNSQRIVTQDKCFCEDGQKNPFNKVKSK